jgi:hypothetical protein
MKARSLLTWIQDEKNLMVILGSTGRSRTFKDNQVWCRILSCSIDIRTKVGLIEKHDNIECSVIPSMCSRRALIEQLFCDGFLRILWYLILLFFDGGAVMDVHLFCSPSALLALWLLESIWYLIISSFLLQYNKLT